MAHEKDRVFPDAVLLLLQPRGNAQATGEVRVGSPGGTLTGQLKWHVVRLWELDAEALFALNDVNLVPWITLTRTAQEPEPFLRRCRAMIDAHAPPRDKENMLVAANFLAAIRYDERYLSTIFAGARAVIESPLMGRIKKIIANEATVANIIRFVTKRFGEMPADLAAQLEQVTDEHRLEELIDLAATSPNLADFRAKL